MPFSISNTVNAATGWVCTNRFVCKATANPLFAALLLTVIVIVLLLGVFYKEAREKGGWKKALRASLYVFVIFAAFMALHHYAVQRLARAEAATQETRDVFQAIRVGGQNGIPIVPHEGAGEDDVEAENAAPTDREDNVGEVEDPETTARPQPAVAPQKSVLHIEPVVVPSSKSLRPKPRG